MRNYFALLVCNENRMVELHIRPLEYNKTSLFSSDKPLKTGVFVFVKHFKFRVCIRRI